MDIPTSSPLVPPRVRSDSAQQDGRAAAAADFGSCLTLLTAQLRNQDPLQPLDGTEFIAQLASFSTVEQLVQVNDRLDALSAGAETQLGAAYAGCIGLAACNGQLDHLGRPRSMTPPGTQDLAVAPPAYERVALIPPPPPPPDTATTASLWRSGPNSLFGDRRARQRGDIVTVIVEIDDEAKLRNSTSRGRSGEDSVALGALYGLTEVAQKVLPTGASLDPAVATSGTTSSAGDGAVTRNEEVTLRVAATVEQVLPNGHLVIRGSQEVRVNFELRDLQISGIVRPEDISRQNVVTYDKIADARIVYGGRGQITDMQQPRYGQQILDLISPF